MVAVMLLIEWLMQIAHAPPRLRVGLNKHLRMCMACYVLVCHMLSDAGVVDCMLLIAMHGKVIVQSHCKQTCSMLIMERKA